MRRPSPKRSSGVFEIGDLDDDGEGFGDEDAADEEEHEFLADDDGDVADEAAERERAGVAHEDLGGVAVEPEEAEAAPVIAPARTAICRCLGCTGGEAGWTERAVADDEGQDAGRRS